VPWPGVAQFKSDEVLLDMCSRPVARQRTGVQAGAHRLRPAEGTTRRLAHAPA